MSEKARSEILVVPVLLAAQEFATAELAIDMEVEVERVRGGLPGAGGEFVAGGGEYVPAAELLAGGKVGGQVRGVGPALE